ncbi:ABC transporter ATP-binding protein [Glutamicibacter protophormiae]|uniref:Peptide/nickel transport system ATP-binding protein n=1 Tax=Glutamicibacter protophormiae TaxID=37930 RepID=A0ABS4XNZ7_GLUPR|nr:ABC transporter ATP-binding protein [Glutamicibacter protophormiae]MBP2398230.1 peptide/nickel transport system ATP-binding protein [Glutamicibacter protophormiae]GGL90457.1 ABC transporter ATP-binding protein [Glutamicibacter protophormiae]
MNAPQNTASPVIRIEDLTVQYAQGTIAADNINLQIPRGQIVAIVGESGSGKSTLTKALIGLLPQGTECTGSIRFGGTEVTTLNVHEWRKIRGAGIGLVPQDPGASLDPVKTIGSQVVEVFRLHPSRSVPKKQWRSKAIELLESVGIDRAESRLSQYPHELSGGLKQRVLIAIAFALNPQLLIADEPTSALDVTVQRTVLEIFVSLARKNGTTVVFVTHDLAVATDIADRVLVMNSGRILEDRSVAELVSKSTDPYTNALLDQAYATANQQEARSTDELAISVTNLGKVFGKGNATHAAVSSVSFDVARGTTFSLVGESGSGKSTTAKIIMGLLEASQGSARVNGNDVTGLGGKQRYALWREAQLVYQNPDSALDPRQQVGSIIAEPMLNYRLGDAAWRRARVAQLMEQVNLAAELASKRPGELSGGQRQRVAIARALASGAKILVLDEALSALDVLTQEQILELLDRLQHEEGLTYLFISHDLHVVERISHQVGVMRGGELVEVGPVAQVFSAPQHEYTRTLLAANPGHVLRELADTRSC